MKPELNAFLHLYANQPSSLNELIKAVGLEALEDDNYQISKNGWELELGGISELSGSAQGPRNLEFFDWLVESLDKTDWDYSIEVFEDSGRLLKRFVK